MITAVINSVLLSTFNFRTKNVQLISFLRTGCLPFRVLIENSLLNKTSKK